MEPTRLQFLGLAIDFLRRPYYKHMLITVNGKKAFAAENWMKRV
jgi:hypothetical protein